MLRIIVVIATLLLQFSQVTADTFIRHPREPKWVGANLADPNHGWKLSREFPKSVRQTVIQELRLVRGGGSSRYYTAGRNFCSAPDGFLEIDSYTQIESVYALVVMRLAEDGTILWATVLPRPGFTSDEFEKFGTIATDNVRHVAASIGDKIFILDLQSGSVLWRYQVAEEWAAVKDIKDDGTIFTNWDYFQSGSGTLKPYRELASLHVPMPVTGTQVSSLLVGTFPYSRRWRPDENASIRRVKPGEEAIQLAAEILMGRFHSSKNMILKYEYDPLRREEEGMLFRAIIKRIPAAVSEGLEAITKGNQKADANNPNAEPVVSKDVYISRGSVLIAAAFNAASSGPLLVDKPTLPADVEHRPETIYWVRKCFETDTPSPQLVALANRLIVEDYTGLYFDQIKEVPAPPR